MHVTRLHYLPIESFKISGGFILRLIASNQVERLERFLVIYRCPWMCIFTLPTINKGCDLKSIFFSCHFENIQE